MAAKPVKDLVVAIVGGGVCGVACAIALDRRGIKAQVYEGAAKFGEIGAGLAFSSNGLRVLEEIGVLRDIMGDSPLGGWDMEWRQGEGSHELIYKHVQSPDEQHFALHRAAFLEAIVKHLDSTYVHFKKRCVNITPSSSGATRYTMHFSDDTTAEADIILLANGINCAVRSVVTGPHETNFVTYANKYCYRGLVKVADLKAAGMENPELLGGSTRLYLGKDKHIIVFSIAGGTMLNIVAYVSDYGRPFGSIKLPKDQSTVVAATTDEIVADYSDFGHDIRQILSCILNPTRWYLTVVWPHLDTFVNGAVALLGDAAHAMLPHIGAGGSQGLEDALLLAELLSNPQTTSENVDDVLKVYDEIRRPRSQFVWEETARAGRAYDGHGKYPRTTEGMERELHNVFDASSKHGVHEDIDAALKRLEETGIFQ